MTTKRNPKCSTVEKTRKFFMKINGPSSQSEHITNRKNIVRINKSKRYFLLLRLSYIVTKITAESNQLKNFLFLKG